MKNLTPEEEAILLKVAQNDPDFERAKEMTASGTMDTRDCALQKKVSIHLTVIKMYEYQCRLPCRELCLHLSWPCTCDEYEPKLSLWDYVKRFFKSFIEPED